MSKVASKYVLFPLHPLLRGMRSRCPNSKRPHDCYYADKQGEREKSCYARTWLPVRYRQQTEGLGPAVCTRSIPASSQSPLSVLWAAASSPLYGQQGALAPICGVRSAGVEATAASLDLETCKAGGRLLKPATVRLRCSYGKFLAHSGDHSLLVSCKKTEDE